MLVPCNGTDDVDQAAVPWMPAVENYPRLGNMGVLLSICTTRVGGIRGSAISARWSSNYASQAKQTVREIGGSPGRYIDASRLHPALFVERELMSQDQILSFDRSTRSERK
jgi:hypothetical protein